VEKFHFLEKFISLQPIDIIKKTAKALLALTVFSYFIA